MKNQEQTPPVLIERRGPGGYGRGGHEIIIAPAGLVAAAARINDEGTTAVFLADETAFDIRPVIAEMPPLACTPGRGYLSLKFRTVAELEAGLEDGLRAELAKHGYEALAKKSRFDYLAADVRRTLRPLSGVFDFSAGVEFFTAVIFKETAPSYHVDYTKYVHGRPVMRPEGRRAVRNFSDATVVALRDHTASRARGSLLYHAVARAIQPEAPQGVCLIKGDTVHASPATPYDRWIYGVSPVLPG